MTCRMMIARRRVERRRVMKDIVGCCRYCRCSSDRGEVLSRGRKCLRSEEWCVEEVKTRSRLANDVYTHNISSCMKSTINLDSL
jgi:CxxC motif-containing protein